MMLELVLLGLILIIWYFGFAVFYFIDKPRAIRVFNEYKESLKNNH